MLQLGVVLFLLHLLSLGFFVRELFAVVMLWWGLAEARRGLAPTVGRQTATLALAWLAGACVLAVFPALPVAMERAPRLHLAGSCVLATVLAGLWLSSEAQQRWRAVAIWLVVVLAGLLGYSTDKALELGQVGVFDKLRNATALQRCQPGSFTAHHPDVQVPPWWIRVGCWAAVALSPLLAVRLGTAAWQSRVTAALVVLAVPYTILSVTYEVCGVGRARWGAGGGGGKGWGYRSLPASTLCLDLVSRGIDCGSAHLAGARGGECAAAAAPAPTDRPF